MGSESGDTGGEWGRSVESHESWTAEFLGREAWGRGSCTAGAESLRLGDVGFRGDEVKIFASTLDNCVGVA